MERQLALVTDRLLDSSNQLKDLQMEGDFLLAQLASRSAAYEDDRTRLQATVEQQGGKLAEQEQTVRLLGETLAERDAYIAALTNTVSWWVTRPLRAVQTRRIRAKMFRRPG
jgi:hypothetical protein